MHNDCHLQCPKSLMHCEYALQVRAILSVEGAFYKSLPLLRKEIRNEYPQ